MRCFLMLEGHIRAVEILDPGTDDSLVMQGQAHFEQAIKGPFDDFEVWNTTRRVYSLSEGWARAKIV
jgi:hypothetical protein